ncbi:hypothetical protein BKG95_10275 [Rodentibacter pneumotropicus]|uniref:Uncharacterized protein n=1 Tax=Rodentibacter pneumotropicus TaxID=758 RepID=A0AAW5LC22_9PAST|nr:hypothetical protein [Rodentibacter pneumotropicus]MCQ9121274.1 hypothetical protein [Rodentibacter pneumotropicus]OOF66585.1 hypothetical protein BKG95_10275 [Rodentibacter pneumotropicus]
MKFKFLGVFKRIFNRFFQHRQKPLTYRPYFFSKNRPHFFSKNAWSYVRRGKPTPAEVITWRLYDEQ